MELIKRIESNIPFSLHDSQIKSIEISDDHLSLYLDRVFEYKKESELYYPAVMTFHGIDLEVCTVKVFDNGNKNGCFTGVQYGIEDYANDCADTEFEILTETYGTYITVLQGLVWGKGSDPATAIINIWNMGNISFKVEESSV